MSVITADVMPVPGQVTDTASRAIARGAGYLATQALEFGMATAGIGMMAAGPMAMMTTAGILQHSLDDWESAAHDDIYGWVIADAFKYEIGDEETPLPPAIAAPPLESPWFGTSMDGVRVRTVPAGIPDIDDAYGFSREIALPAPVRVRRRLEPVGLTHSYGKPIELPPYYRTPARQSEAKPDVLWPTYVPPMTLPEYPADRILGYPDIPDTRIGVYVHPSTRTIEVRTIPRATGAPMTNILRSDQKPMSATMYVAAQRMLTRTVGTATELFDWFRVFRQNVRVQNITVWVESVRQPGAFYRIKIDGPRRLSTLPYNAQRAIMAEIAAGEYDEWTLDVEGLAAGLYAQELADYSRVIGTGMERQAIDAVGSFGLTDIGNFSTWNNRIQSAARGIH